MTARFVVVGNPVAHSLSPMIHQAFAAQQSVDMTYEREWVALDGFVEFAQGFCHSGGFGMNVTLPFKGDAYEWCSRHDEAAHCARAVNTIVCQTENGLPLGYNTDGLGLVRDLQVRHRQAIEGTRILLLGAGGASQGVLHPLLAANPQHIDVANRTASKAHAMALAVADERVTGMSVQDVCGPYDLVINATSLGLSGESISLVADVVRDAFCYDMVYGEKAVFQRWALQHGAKVSVDGLGMLVEQAAESFVLWHTHTGITRPDTDAVIAAVYSLLSHD